MMRRSLLILAILVAINIPTGISGEINCSPTSLIQQLSADNFETRRAAYGNLEKLGEDARLALENALNGRLIPDTRESITRLLGKMPPKRVVYAKILVPNELNKMKLCLKTEPWILEALKIPENKKVDAVTDWLALSPDAQKFKTIKHCIRPFGAWVATTKTEQSENKIEVHFDLTGPFPIKVTGNILPDELGERGVAIIDDGSSYVALFVGPEPRHKAVYQREGALPKDGEEEDVP